MAVDFPGGADGAVQRVGVGLGSQPAAGVAGAELRVVQDGLAEGAEVGGAGEDAAGTNAFHVSWLGLCEVVEGLGMRVANGWRVHLRCLEASIDRPTASQIGENAPRVWRGGD